MNWRPVLAIASNYDLRGAWPLIQVLEAANWWQQVRGTGKAAEAQRFLVTLAIIHLPKVREYLTNGESNGE